VAGAGGGYFDRLYRRLLDEGRSPFDARQAAFDAYLDGKPQSSGKHKPTRHERDSWFWDSELVGGCGPDHWCTEAGTLALTRYLSQARVRVGGLVEGVARAAPQALVVAMRRARLVLTPDSPHLQDLRSASALSPDVEASLRVHDVLVAARRERQVELARCQVAVADTTAFELLVLASLHAYEVLVPHSMTGQSFVEEHRGRRDVHWDAINDLLAWKLRDTPLESLRLDDERMGRSLKQYLSPLLFPDRALPKALLDRMQAFARLLVAQIELNEFLSRSADAHCFDDSVRFVPIDDRRLDLVETDPAAKTKWQRDGRKLELLPGYWLHRAFHDFASSDMALVRIGRPENEAENRLAYIRAMATRLRLREVYGVADTVTAPTGESAELFQALLSLELTARFFMLDFIAPFVEGAERADDWIASLQQLALGGLANGMQNRFPLAWSARAEKVAKTTAWTVTPSHPAGSARMAAAIIDFWTHDMLAEAERVRTGAPGLAPRLIERPYLKFGQQLVQLPWVAAMQNNSTAAINNLRRLAARRDEAAAETHRIESRLAEVLRGRGFRVALNWQPPAQWRDAGEVDVIAARDGHLFILEIKSTFIRRSMQEAWLHASTTLRKAGLQLRRKVQAMEWAVASDDATRGALALSPADPPATVHGWIVDTSVESDHERFSGFLKVSLEEVIIALRDDRRLLLDPEGLVSGRLPATFDPVEDSVWSTLYPSGFDAPRFLAVIESELVWEALGQPTEAAGRSGRHAEPEA
jgi:Holliday junction resolvase-like predicted endonuclease